MLWLRNLLLEVGPVIVFFITEAQFDFFSAIFATVGATFVAVIFSRIFDGAVPLFALVTLPVFVILGGVSVYLKNEQYFILTDTIFYLGFSTALFWSLHYKRPFLMRLFESSFAITIKGWRVLTIRWAVFFLLLAIGNEYVRFTLSVDAWVTYKLYTSFAVLAFGTFQFTLSMKERIPEESNWLGLRIK